MPLGWGEYPKRAPAGDHDVAMLGNTWDYPDPVAAANAGNDKAERDRLYRHAQQIFQEEVGGMLFANSQTVAPVRKEVVGYKIHGFGGQPCFGVSLMK